MPAYVIALMIMGLEVRRVLIFRVCHCCDGQGGRAGGVGAYTSFVGACTNFMILYHVAYFG